MDRAMSRRSCGLESGRKNSRQELAESAILPKQNGRFRPLFGGRRRLWTQSAAPQGAARQRPTGYGNLRSLLQPAVGDLDRLGPIAQSLEQQRVGAGQET